MKTNLDLHQNSLMNARIQNLATAPTAPKVGQIYFSIAGEIPENVLKVWDGTQWVALATGGSTEELDTRVTALEGTVGDSNSGLVKDVATLQSEVEAASTGLLARVTAIEGSAYATSGIDSTKVAQIATNASDITALETAVGDASSGLTKAVADNATAITALQNAGYITKDVNDLTNYYKKTETYTQAEVDSAISTAVTGAYKVKGSKTVAQINALTGMVQGDVYNVSDSGTITTGSVAVNAGDNVVWDGSAWDKLAGTINLTGYYTKTETDNLLADKVTKNSDITGGTFPKITFDAKGLVTGGAALTASDIPEIAESQVTNLVTDLANKLDDTQLVTAFQATPDDTHIPSEKLVSDQLATKVDKVNGKQLSTEDFTTALKTKLEGVAAGAQVNVIETVKVNGAAQTVTDKAVDITVPTEVSDLTNDAQYQTASDVTTTLANYYTKTQVGTALFVEANLTFTGADSVYTATGTVNGTAFMAQVLLNNKVVGVEITLSGGSYTITSTEALTGAKVRIMVLPDTTNA